MNEHRDPDRLIHAFLREGQTELADPVFDVVRDTIEHKRQRVVIGPWRLPDMNKLVPIGLGAAAVVVVLVVGTQLLGPTASSGSGGAASPSPPIGGTVTFHMDGAPATTTVDTVADGASVSGTAVVDARLRHPHRRRRVCRPRRRYLGLRRHDQGDHRLRRAGGRLVGGRRQRRLAPTGRYLALRQQDGWHRLRCLAHCDRHEHHR